MNEILLSIANRDDFSTPGLTIPGGFVPDVGTADTKEVRELLRLEPSSDDLYVKGLLLAVEAYPEVRDAFDEVGRSYDLKYLSVRPPSFTGGFLGSGMHGEAYVNRVPDEWPMFYTMSLTKQEDGGWVMVGGNHVTTVSVYESDYALDVDWPYWAGVGGRVYPTATTNPGYKFTIEHEPTGYPYNKVVEVLKGSQSFRIILRDRGLVVPFYYAQSSVEKVAIAALALGRSNKRVYPNG